MVAYNFTFATLSCVVAYLFLFSVSVTIRVYYSHFAVTIDFCFFLLLWPLIFENVAVVVDYVNK